MNEEHAARYIFPQALTEQAGLTGLPTDETVVLFSPMGWGVCSGKYVTGLVIAALLWMCLKHFKKGRGSVWLFNACYWYLPFSLFKRFYRIIPDSAYRLWLR